MRKEREKDGKEEGKEGKTEMKNETNIHARAYARVCTLDRRMKRHKTKDASYFREADTRPAIGGCGFMGSHSPSQTVCMNNRNKECTFKHNAWLSG
jgi:hypothetical protein